MSRRHRDISSDPHAALTIPEAAEYMGLSYHEFRKLCDFYDGDDGQRLVTTWPAKPGSSHRRTSRANCDSARAAMQRDDAHVHGRGARRSTRARHWAGGGASPATERTPRRPTTSSDIAEGAPGAPDLRDFYIPDEPTTEFLKRLNQRST